MGQAKTVALATVFFYTEMRFLILKLVSGGEKYGIFDADDQSDRSII